MAYFDIASDRIANLSLYCRNISFSLLDDIPSEQTVDSCPLPLIPSKPIAFIPSGAKTQKIKRIDHRKCNVRASKNADQAYFLSSSSLLTSPPHPLKTIAFIPSGAKTQKIKRIDHRKCNVRASKNAG